MCEPRRGGLGIDLLTVFGRNQPWWSETSSLPNWETEPFCCFSATQFVVPRDGSSRKLKWAKSACFELKNNHLLWNPIFIILYLSDLGQVHLTSLCFTFLPWNGESGTNLPGTLWQMMLLSAWRVQGERDDLVNAGGGRREPAGYVVGGGQSLSLFSSPATLCLPPAYHRQGRAYIVRPFPAFLSAHLASFILVLSLFPICFSSGPLPNFFLVLPSSLSKPVSVTPSSARCFPRPFRSSWATQLSFLPPAGGSYSRRVSSNSFPGPGSANVFSDACQHSFSLPGLGSNLLLPHLGILAHAPNALTSGLKVSQSAG